MIALSLTLKGTKPPPESVEGLAVQRDALQHLAAIVVACAPTLKAIAPMSCVLWPSHCSCTAACQDIRECSLEAPWLAFCNSLFASTAPQHLIAICPGITPATRVFTTSPM